MMNIMINVSEARRRKKIGRILVSQCERKRLFMRNACFFVHVLYLKRGSHGMCPVRKVATKHIIIRYVV